MDWAYQRGKHTNTAYKYKKFSAPRKAKNEIVTLTDRELISLYKFDFSKDKRLERVRDLFCFGCFTGQRWSDIENFKKGDLSGEVWKFISVKTKKQKKIPFRRDKKAVLVGISKVV